MATKSTMRQYDDYNVTVRQYDGDSAHLTIDQTSRKPTGNIGAQVVVENRKTTFESRSNELGGFRDNTSLLNVPWSVVPGKITVHILTLKLGSHDELRNVSEREERLQRRNIEKEMEEIRHGRQYIQERNRTRLNESVHACESPLRTQERTTSSSRQQRVSSYVPLHEGENLEDLDRFLEEAHMELRERINSHGSNYVDDTEQTQTKTFEQNKSAQQQETETDSRYGRHAHLIRNREENVHTERELELRRRLLELEDRESKHREREEHMYKYWKRKEFDLQQTEREMTHKFNSREERLLSQEMKLRDMEISLSERMQKLECKLEMRENRITEGFWENERNETVGNASVIEKCSREKIDQLQRKIEALQKEKALLEPRLPDVDVLSYGKTLLRKDGIRDSSEIKLNISSFSGEVPVPRSESSFEDFKLEVDSVKTIYAEHVVKQGLRRALKGQAKKKMLHMLADATVDEIMTELEDNFGNVAMLQQETGESVTQWGLRLEEMLLQVTRKTKIDDEERRVMLKKSEELRNATRVHFENNVPYEELRNKVREEEFEDNRHKIGKTDACQSNELLQQLMKKIESLDRKLEDLKKGHTELQIPQVNTDREGSREVDTGDAPIIIRITEIMIILQTPIN
ncbi:hypothetical protein DPMN_149019 [Dreissena polymorpha]|uniref:Uncharacterized protein n=1 Tax=Dreissena polymorpha TaxID=45954 RepID=A0A9D4FGN5_DREPO|nr:hypothetical protein DPMN_149019 [Dreissena polymorpha]